MDPNFNLIKLVDPSKSSSKIKDKFAKLTLSSNRKKQVEREQHEEHADNSATQKSHPSRRLFDDILTDDDSDTENEALNRIFRSKTTTKTSDNVTKEPLQTTSVRRSKSFSQRLQMSDSDETTCSKEDIAYARRSHSEPMERLQLSSTQTDEKKSFKLFTSNGITDKSDIPLQQISNKLSSLDIEDNSYRINKGSSDQRREDRKLENILLQEHLAMKTEIMEATPVKPRISIMTISSTATSPLSVEDEDDDSEIVIISESDSESDFSYPVSTIRNTDSPPIISDTMRERLDAFFENIPPLSSSEGPERIFLHNLTLKESEGRSEQINQSLPDESIEICESSIESDRNRPQMENKITPEKRILRSAANTPTKVTAPSLQQITSPINLDTPQFIQKQATPRKIITPRKTPSNQVASHINTPQGLNNFIDPLSAQSKGGTPKKTPTPKVKQKARTPRSTPTPKARQKNKRTPLKAKVSPDEQNALPEAETNSSPPTVPRPSDAASSCSSEYRIEKINISATIKIRLQFNDDLVASVQTSPFTSTSTNRFPRLTESESAPDTEERVRTPDHFKQRSLREQNALTFIDITKNSITSPSSTIKEGIGTDSNTLAENVKSPPIENQHTDAVATSSPPFPTLELSASPMKDAASVKPDSLCKDHSLVKQSLGVDAVPNLPEVSTPARSQPIQIIQETPKITSPDNVAPIAIDDTAQKLLDQIYGDAWKTPALVKSIRKTRPTNDPLAKDESMIDFSRFNTNIRCDLESTRLPELTQSPRKEVQAEHVFKVPATERRVEKKKEIFERKATTERKPRRIKGQSAIRHAPATCDSDRSDSDLNASSDESWNERGSTSSYSDSDSSTNKKNRNPGTKKKTVKKSKKKNSKDEVRYLDLSSDVVKVVHEVNDSPFANKDEGFQQRLEEYLNTFKCPDKKKLEPTPKTHKTKRKLFTPRFGEEDETSPVLSDKGELNSLSDDIVTLTAPLPSIFEPINKHLEAVKRGKPIFLLNTPKTPKTSSKKNKENLPSSNKTSHSTPKTPQRSTSKKRENLETGLLSTPCDTYGFLQSLDVNVAKTFCHPEALIYRENYKTKKQDLAEKLYSIYNANIFNDGLDVALHWNKKLLNTAGRCSCSTKLGKRLCRIELSEKVLTSADRLRCTLIHELCHAATWIYSGEHGHGATWKKWARKANEIFPELPKIQVCHDYDIDYKYTYKCTLCNAKSHAHSKSKKVENIRCAYCHGAIEVFLNKKDKDGNILPTPVREPTGFAKFVKENYKKHKRPDLKHADVMRVLSNEFALLNVDEKK